MLRIVHDELPELFQFVFTCYKSSSHLSFEDFLISSDERAQQGDPSDRSFLCNITETSHVDEVRIKHLVHG